jgi:hypothetical protein
MVVRTGKEGGAEKQRGCCWGEGAEQRLEVGGLGLAGQSHQKQNRGEALDTMWSGRLKCRRRWQGWVVGGEGPVAAGMGLAHGMQKAPSGGDFQEPD